MVRALKRRSRLSCQVARLASLAYIVECGLVGTGPLYLGSCLDYCSAWAAQWPKCRLAAASGLSWPTWHGAARRLCCNPFPPFAPLRNNISSTQPRPSTNNDATPILTTKDRGFDHPHPPPPPPTRSPSPVPSPIAVALCTATTFQRHHRLLTAPRVTVVTRAAAPKALTSSVAGSLTLHQARPGARDQAHSASRSSPRLSILECADLSGLEPTLPWPPVRRRGLDSSCRRLEDSRTTAAWLPETKPVSPSPPPPSPSTIQPPTLDPDEVVEYRVLLCFGIMILGAQLLRSVQLA